MPINVCVNGHVTGYRHCGTCGSDKTTRQLADHTAGPALVARREALEALAQELDDITEGATLARCSGCGEMIGFDLIEARNQHAIGCRFLRSWREAFRLPFRAWRKKHRAKIAARIARRAA